MPIGIRVLYMLLFAVAFCWILIWVLAVTVIADCCSRCWAESATSGTVRFSKGISGYIAQVVEFLAFYPISHPFPLLPGRIGIRCNEFQAECQYPGGKCLNLHARIRSSGHRYPGHGPRAGAKLGAADCVGTRTAASAKAPAARKSAGAATQQDTGSARRRSITSCQARTALRLANDDADTDTSVEVSVKGVKTVVVPGAPGNQLQAIPWAILHPTQAWRIFTPLVDQP